MDIDPEKPFFLQKGIKKIEWHLLEGLGTRIQGSAHQSYGQTR